jgi:hypothetical protein
LRETAKWIVSGIAVAVAGVIAGTSLSNFGTLQIGGWRFFTAVSAIVVGLAWLAILFRSALRVIVPPRLTLQEVADRKGVCAHRGEQIECATKPYFGMFSNTLVEFCALLMEPKTHDGSPFPQSRKDKLWEVERLTRSAADCELRRHLYDELIGSTYWVTPIIVLAFIVFAWASNPKDELRVVPALEKIVDVNQDDFAVLRKILALRHVSTQSCA